VPQSLVLLAQLLTLSILVYLLAKFVGWLQDWSRSRLEASQVETRQQAHVVAWEPLPVSPPSSPRPARSESASVDWKRSSPPTPVLEDDIHRTFKMIISQTRGVDEEECVPSARLFVDLGLESIDFLEISFRMEEEFGFHYPTDDLGRVMTSLSENSTSADVERALERLRTDLFVTVPADLEGVQPFDAAKLRSAVHGLFTVQYLHDYVISMRKRDGM